MAAAKTKKTTGTPAKKPASAKKPVPAAIAAPASPMAGMSTPHKVAWIALQVLVFAVPLAMSNANWLSKLGLTAFGLPLTFDQFDIVKVFIMRACALVGVGAWSFDFFIRGGKLRRTKADYLILAFLGWVLVTSFTSISFATAFFGKYRRFEGFLSFLTYAIVFFLTVQLVDRPSRIRSLTHTFVVSGIAVSFYGILQFFGADPVSWGSNLPFETNRAFSTFGNPDLLGGFIVLVLPLALAMALTEKRPVWRVVYWVGFIITAFCWGASFVRGAWIGGAFALIALAVGAVLARVPWGVIDWSASGATAFFGAAFVAWSLRSTHEVLNIWTRLQSIFKFNEGSALTRFEIWSAAIRAVKERPIFGFGADTFRLVFPHTKPVEYVRDAGYLSVADNVHNYPLQLAAGVGIVGFLLLYGLFGWVLYLGAPSAFSRGKGPERLLLTAFWGAALGYIIHLMFGLSVTGSSVFLWLSLAMVIAPTARTVEVAPKTWGRSAAVVIVAVATAASVYNVVYIVADNYYLKAQFAVSANANPLTAVKTAISLNPFNDMYRAQLGETYRAQMGAWVQQAQTNQQAGKDPAADLQQAKDSFLLAEQAYLDVIDFVPTEYDNYVFLTALYNQAGSYFDRVYFEKALVVADQGIAAEEFGPAIRFQKALALYNLGRVEDVITTLEPTVKMDPRYTDPMLVLADAYKQVGRIEEARAMYTAVLAVANGQSVTDMANSGLASLTASGSTETSTP
ncbi:MAG: O-antigen ligase family protein [Coriobacteriia bacterium]|nr:O-antigen ligase family protein [Coriobacteriia bacterium]